MPWREAAERALVGVVLVGAAISGLGATNAAVPESANDLDVRPPPSAATSSSTTTTTVPLLPPPPAPPVTMPPRLGEVAATRALTRAMRQFFETRVPLRADVVVFAAQVSPRTDLRVMARSFVANRYAHLIAHRRCELVVGPEAWTEPAWRYPVRCGPTGSP